MTEVLTQVTVPMLIQPTSGPPLTINVYAFQDPTGNYYLGSQPVTDGINVGVAHPMQVTDAAAETSLASVATNTGATTTVLGTIATNTTGLATAANQTTGNTSAAATATGVGTPADTAWSGSGSGSLVALLKAVFTSIASLITNTTGLATATSQGTTNTSLGTIVTNTTGVATAANQTTGNTSLGTIATNTTGAATAANQTTGNTSLASIVANTHQANSVLGYEQLILVGGTAAPFATIPAGAKMAVIVSENALVRWRDDGTAPTNSIGMPLSPGVSWVYAGPFATLQFIAPVAAIVNVSFYA